MECIGRPDDKFYGVNKVYLPPKQKGKKTLFLDIDETLAHCITESDKGIKNQLPSHKIQFVLPNGKDMSAEIILRPGVKKFLNFAQENFEVVAFTASNSCYANSVLELLDPEAEIFSFRMFREHCYESKDKVHIKDLSVIKNRNLEDILLVDNAPYSYGFNMDNGVPILSFYGDKEDTELEKLEIYLKRCIEV